MKRLRHNQKHLKYAGTLRGILHAVIMPSRLLKDYGKMKKELKRTKQCKKCPWKTTTNPLDIPDGYCELKHQNLKETIAEYGEVNMGVMKVMACHHSNGEDEMYCVGWLNNQLGVGNNIGLRMKMIAYKNTNNIEVFGEQHNRFEQTLPQ